MPSQLRGAEAPSRSRSPEGQFSSATQSSEDPTGGWATSTNDEGGVDARLSRASHCTSVPHLSPFWAANSRLVSPLARYRINHLARSSFVNRRRWEELACFIPQVLLAQPPVRYTQP